MKGTKRKLVLAIDFDGTIVEHAYPRMGKLKSGAREAINALYDDGYTIIIWTCRYLLRDLKACEKFLHDNNIKYHYINQNATALFDSRPKIFADVYIDDKGYKFTDWANTLWDIKQLDSCTKEELK